MVHVQEDERGTRRDGLAKLNHVIFILGADEVWSEVYRFPFSLTKYERFPWWQWDGLQLLVEYTDTALRATSVIFSFMLYSHYIAVAIRSFIASSNPIALRHQVIPLRSLSKHGTFEGIPPLLVTHLFTISAYSIVSEDVFRKLVLALGTESKKRISRILALANIRECNTMLIFDSFMLNYMVRRFPIRMPRSKWLHIDL